MNYSKCYLFFSGYYMVNAAADVLTRFHVENRVVRAPVALANSCSFAVLVAARDAEMACFILRRENIRILKKEYV